MDFFHINQNEMFRYFKTSQGFDLKKAYPNDAGYDICSSTSLEIPAKGKALIPTGLYLEIPDGYYGRIASRSGLAVKFDLEVGAGVIDSGYRDEVKVLLRNFGEKPFIIMNGDRIAQLIIEKIFIGEVHSLENREDLSPSNRDKKGFGSTGV